MKKKQKKQMREARAKAHDMKIIQESERILSSLGIRETLKATTFYQQIVRVRFPRIAVDAAVDLPRTTEVEAIVQEAKNVVGNVRFDFPIVGKINVDCYFRVVKPILEMLTALRSLDPNLQSCLAEFRKKTAELASLQVAAAAVANLFYALDELIIKVCRIDTRLYYWKLLHDRNVDGKYAVSFSLRMAPAIKKRFHTCDGERIGYRCGQPHSYRGIDWVSFESSLFGIKHSEPMLPVYVQAHALDKLYRREGRAHFIENGEWLVHDYLWQSLRKKRVHPLPSQPNKLLIEYSLNAHKLGYLVAQLVEGAVLVDTFLFLTMDGTPEGDMLRQKLKLRRFDKEQLGLDRIETFLFSDIQNDAELVAMLTECGCGHLFKILKEAKFREEVMEGYADDMRHYLRLSSN